MALIKCPKCQNEISEKSKKCIHCGTALIEDFSSEKFCIECSKAIPIDVQICPFCGCPIKKEKNIKLIVANLMKNGNRYIPLIVFVISIVTLFLIRSGVDSMLNSYEKLAYQNVLQLQSMLKNPDSFKLYDEIFLLEKYDTAGNLEYTYTIIEYGATNGFGGMTKGEAIFKDNTYIADFDDNVDVSDLEKTEVLLELHLLLYKGDTTLFEKIDVDIEKIKNKIGQK